MCKRGRRGTEVKVDVGTVASRTRVGPCRERPPFRVYIHVYIYIYVRICMYVYIVLVGFDFA